MTIHIIGTTHHSEQSGREVRRLIQTVKPDAVAIELDEDRLKNVGGKVSMLSTARTLTQLPRTEALVLSVFAIPQLINYYAQGKPMGDMESAVTKSNQHDIPIHPIDKEAGETIADAAATITIPTNPVTLYRRFTEWLESIPPMPDDVVGTDLNDPEPGEVEATVEYFREILPDIVRVILDERNEIMAERIDRLDAEYDDIVVVVGRAHVHGIEELL